MHLPCVLIFFAVVIRPVSAGAHTEPSDVVNSYGRPKVPVKRYLRVQERAYDVDDDERTAFADGVAEFFASKRSAEPLVSDRLSKRFRVGDVVDDSTQMATWQKVVEKDYNENLVDTGGVKRAGDILESEYRPGKVSRIGDAEDRPNKHIDIGEDNIFEQPMMVSWVKMVDEHNVNYPSKQITLLNVMLKDYSLKQLVKAAVKSPSNNIATRVQDEIRQFLLAEKTTPDNVFTWLHLDELKGDLFDSPLYPFYMNYWMYYLSKLPSVRVLEDFSVEKLPIMFGKIQTSAFTRRVEEEIIGKLLKYWTDNNTEFTKVKDDVLKIELAAEKGSVYESALLKAAHAYALSAGKDLIP
ncbi:hypothetical protein DD238_001059 [Peronospora effusa]|uniref:RxLR effector protein n=1 Tax=Peronospora effusa TaxID=542832 RepID=A0A3M6VTQ9_9STRA|nr:hypothetical protein DD238_001059 [Peronospora effusa]